MANTQLQALQLAEQINDEFLTCKICYEHYKEPKCLSCLHTFCEECIEQHVSAQRSYKYTDYREFSCPICRKKTVIPTGGVRKLNDNFLISSLNELLLSKRPSKIPTCDICRIVNQRDREATSKCVECQKFMCKTCVNTHQQMKITTNHSIYELEIEKDIMCKKHPNEQVRFYCEACEVCVCVPCTFTDHRDHDLVDFKQGISHHKDKIEENLRTCRQKIAELRNRLDLLRQCETRMLYAQNEIHANALAFVEAIRQRELSLLEELTEYYGDETTEYLKKKDDMEAFLDQLKSTCNLTEMVVKGKDIEMLLLKKQLCDKFDEFEEIELEPIPRNIMKKVCFVKGVVDLGRIANPDTLNEADTESYLNSNEKFNQQLATTTTTKKRADLLNSLEETEEEEKETMVDRTTQINYRDMREILGDKLRETESQTDIRMIHDLVPPTKLELLKLQQQQAGKCDTKAVQTDEQQEQPAAKPSHPPLSNQSSLEDDTNPNGPVDRNKLGRRVRRHVKPGCSIAVLPSSEIIIIDPEANCLTVLDRRGKFRYGMSNASKPCTENGHQSSNPTQFGNVSFGHLPKLEKGVRIMTPQGTLTIKLENETLSDTPNVAVAVHAYDRMAAAAAADSNTTNKSSSASSSSATASE